MRENLLTYFNLVFLVLALCLVAVKASILNLSFVIVVIINAVIGIVQELRSKKGARCAEYIDRAAMRRCARGGAKSAWTCPRSCGTISSSFSTGEQVCADAVVVDGTCLVNEALVTGEADEIRKAPGDTLLSGSFLVSGMCRARLTAVGADSFVSRLTLDAKAQKKRQAKGMMKALNDLVKWIGIGIIPMGVLLVVKEVHWLGRSIPAGVTSTVGALVGMIPEGVYLLTSLALVAGVLRLAQKKDDVPRDGLHRNARARRYALRGQDRHGDGKQNDRGRYRPALPRPVHRRGYPHDHGGLLRGDARR